MMSSVRMMTMWAVGRHQEQKEQEEQLNNDLLAILTVTMDHLDLKN
jgi:hypothetical protein